MSCYYKISLVSSRNLHLFDYFTTIIDCHRRDDHQNALFISVFNKQVIVSQFHTFFSHLTLKMRTSIRDMAIRWGRFHKTGFQSTIPPDGWYWQSEEEGTQKDCSPQLLPSTPSREHTSCMVYLCFIRVHGE